MPNNTPRSVTSIHVEQQLEAPQSSLVLQKFHVSNLKKLDTTPSVKNVQRCVFDNVAPVSVTYFDDGQVGQHIQILGDGQTTLIQDTDKISMIGAADLLLVAGRVYNFTLFIIALKPVWVEH